MPGAAMGVVVAPPVRHEADNTSASSGPEAEGATCRAAGPRYQHRPPAAAPACRQQLRELLRRAGGMRARSRWAGREAPAGAEFRQSRANPSLNAEFPASREFTGNFIDSEPHGASISEKKGIKSERYEPIPYASEQRIFCGLAGNLNRRAGKFPPRSGNPALVRYLGPTGTDQSDPPERSRTLPRSKEGRRQMLA
jgi:hypothetical protein